MLDLENTIRMYGRRQEYVTSRRKYASDLLEMMKGRIFFYSFPELIDNIGFCIIQNISFDILSNNFIYCIKDYDNGHIFITDRCNICLIEIIKG